MGDTMALLTGWYLTMFWMAEGTGLIGVSGLTLHEGVIDFHVAAATNFFRFSQLE